MPLSLSSSPDGSGNSSSVSKLVKDLGVQNNNAFSPLLSALTLRKIQASDLRNEALLPTFFYIRFYPVTRVSIVSAPRIWYVGLVLKVASVNSLE